jgi:hypothetical protein
MVMTGVMDASCERWFEVRALKSGFGHPEIRKSPVALTDRNRANDIASTRDEAVSTKISDNSIENRLNFSNPLFHIVSPEMAIEDLV